MARQAPVPRSIVVPSLGVAMEDARLVAWLKQPGDAVEADEPVVEIETDKTTLDLVAPVTGRLGPHLYREQATLAVGDTVAAVYATDEDAPLLVGGTNAADRAPSRLLPIDLAGLPRRSLLEWLSTMLLIREFEESLDALAMEGKILAGVHLASGQEAVAVGASRALAGREGTPVGTSTDGVTVGQAFQQGVREEMERDKRIFVIGTDLFRRGGHFGQVKGLGELFGKQRVRDTRRSPRRRRWRPGSEPR